MGRIATPAETAIAAGAAHAHAGRYQPTGKADGPIGDPPEGASPAVAAAWRDLVEHSIPGVLTEADRTILAQVAALKAEFEADMFKFPATKHGKLATLLAHLGMTPSGRRSLPPVTAAKKAEDFGGF